MKLHPSKLLKFLELVINLFGEATYEPTKKALSVTMYLPQLREGLSKDDKEVYLKQVADEVHEALTESLMSVFESRDPFSLPVVPQVRFDAEIDTDGFVDFTMQFVVNSNRRKK